ncbi:hypothetical protein C9374_009104 [Naegleria lovaniensis]|uniref:Uncharacterized protein n=1 Tax=Naegleria lovaniensis TaxID=51637 RepID=A0AA88GK42_NAELO|nr:uncharacterized protein C9374_009104 [Naegleria lovaniensis]KAG2377588.1 hypothetical protein C9374_009104 [Naegleria lovaniensis]
MDLLKLEFGKYFKEDTTMNAMQQWIEMSQDLKEDCFSLIFECIYISRPKTDVTTIRTSHAQRNYGKMLEELASETSMTQLEFVNNFMNPLYQALSTLKKKEEREKMDPVLINKLHVIHYITEHYFQKAGREASLVIMMLLLAIYQCREEEKELFSNTLHHVTLTCIETLIDVWHNYIIILVLTGSQKVSFKPILETIKQTLRGDSGTNVHQLYKTQCKAKDLGGANGWQQKIQRQLDQSKDTQKVEMTQLAKSFEVTLKIVHFYDMRTSGAAPSFDICSMDDYDLVQIRKKPSDLKKKEGSGAFLKIGNYQLCLKKKQSDFNKVVNPLTDANILFVSSIIMIDDNTSAKEAVNQITEKIIAFLEKIIRENNSKM